VLGNDVTGVVIALGSGVSSRREGDHVVGHANIAPGSTPKRIAAVCCAGCALPAVIPKGISDHDAATLPTNIIAPLVALFDEKSGLGIPAPWTKEAESLTTRRRHYWLWAAGSNCGRFGVQLARLVEIGKIVVVG